MNPFFARSPVLSEVLYKGISQTGGSYPSSPINIIFIPPNGSKFDFNYCSLKSIIASILHPIMLLSSIMRYSTSLNYYCAFCKVSPSRIFKDYLKKVLIGRCNNPWIVSAFGIKNAALAVVAEHINFCFNSFWSNLIKNVFPHPPLPWIIKKSYYFIF